MNLVEEEEDTAPKPKSTIPNMVPWMPWMKPAGVSYPIPAGMEELQPMRVDAGEFKVLSSDAIERPMQVIDAELQDDFDAVVAGYVFCGSDDDVE